LRDLDRAFINFFSGESASSPLKAGSTLSAKIYGRVEYRELPNSKEVGPPISATAPLAVSTGLTFRSAYDRKLLNIESSVVVPVTIGPAAKTSPLPMMQLECLIEPTAYTTGLRGRIEPINLFGIGPVPVAFVAQKPPEHPPTRIGARLGQKLILEHPPDIELFNFAISGLLYQLLTQFMQKILALVRYLFMPFGNGRIFWQI